MKINEHLMRLACLHARVCAQNDLMETVVASKLAPLRINTITSVWTHMRKQLRCQKESKIMLSDCKLQRDELINISDITKTCSSRHAQTDKEANN